MYIIENPVELESMVLDCWDEEVKEGVVEEKGEEKQPEQKINKRKRSLYTNMIDKFGKEEADRRYKECKDKISKSVKKAYIDGRLVPGSSGTIKSKVAKSDNSNLEEVLGWLDTNPFGFCGVSEIDISEPNTTKGSSHSVVVDSVKIEIRQENVELSDNSIDELKINNVKQSEVEKRYCACNQCGLEVEEGQIYIHGHNLIGKKRPIEVIEKIVATRKKHKEEGKPEKVSIICMCGDCNLLTEPGRRYIVGHNNNNWSSRKKNYSRKCPNPENNSKCLELIWYTYEKDCVRTEGKLCRSCGRLGDKNAAFGKPAHPNIIKAARKQRGEKHPMYGKKYTVEQRKANSIRVKKLYADGILVPNGFGKKTGISGVYDGRLLDDTLYKIEFNSTAEMDLIIEYEKNGKLQNLVRADRNDGYHLIVIYDGDRTFHPDFRDLESNHVMEVKEFDIEGKSGWDEITRKNEAAEKQLQIKGLTYELMKRREMDKQDEVFKLREQYKITLDDKWEEQYWDYVFGKPLSLCKDPSISK